MSYINDDCYENKQSLCEYNEMDIDMAMKSKFEECKLYVPDFEPTDLFKTRCDYEIMKVSYDKIGYGHPSEYDYSYAIKELLKNTTVVWCASGQNAYWNDVIDPINIQFAAWLKDFLWWKDSRIHYLFGVTCHEDNYMYAKKTYELDPKAIYSNIWLLAECL